MQESNSSRRKQANPSKFGKELEIKEKTTPSLVMNSETPQKVPTEMKMETDEVSAFEVPETMSAPNHLSCMVGTLLGPFPTRRARSSDPETSRCKVIFSFWDKFYTKLLSESEDSNNMLNRKKLFCLLQF
jgi:hypothetical protein